MFERCHNTPWVVAETAEVVAIYRSPGPQSLAGGQADLPPVEGFAVVIGSNGRQQVFAALYLKELRRALVYVVHDPQQLAPPPDALLQRALARFAACGFHLDPVNLNYGAAMRDVVVRDIPVLIAPEAAKKVADQEAALQAELQRQADDATEDENQTGLADLSPGRRAALDLARKERLELARAALRKLENQRRGTWLLERIHQVYMGLPDELADDEAAPPPPSPPATELVPGTGDFAVTTQEAPTLATVTHQAAAMMAADQADRERLASEKKRLEQRAATLAEAARQAADKAQADQREVARLKARQAEAEVQARAAAERASASLQAEKAAHRDKARLAQEKEAAENRAAQLASDVAAAVERATRDRAERDRLAAEKSTAEGEAGRLAAILRQVEERLEQERQIREQLEQEKADAERRLNVLAETVRRAETQIAAEKIEREALALERAERQRLVAEKSVLEKRVAEMAEARLAADRKGREMLIQEQVERQRLAAERSALEKRAAELAAAARQAEEQARAERRTRERVAAGNREREILLAEKNRLEQHAAELERVARMAADKAERERRERESLLAAKAQAEERLAALQSQKDPAVVSGGSASRGLPRFSLGGGNPSPVQRRCGPVRGAFFSVDLDLEGVSCDAARDVLEVQQSINQTQLSLEGFPNQYTSAWIVGLRYGRARTVRVVFWLSDSQRALVFRPLGEPQGERDYALVRQEAQKFLRVAGLEMERVPLGRTSQEQSRVLATMPIFLPAAKGADGSSGAGKFTGK